MVTKEGLPVGYDVFPGNMYEGDTFKAAIEKIKIKDDEILRIAAYQYTKNRRLIVTHSTKRAEKDRRDREKSIEKLRLKLDPQSLIRNYGYKKYLAVDGEIQVGVNEDKIERQSLWDGLHGVFTNVREDDMKVEEILSQYHGLWQVEESFRISRHDLRVRPVFHWSAKRIKAHIAICFIAFSLIRFLQYRPMINM